MPIDLDFIEEDIDVIELSEINELDVTALGAMFIKYANTNEPKNETEEGYYFITQDTSVNPNKDYYIEIDDEIVLFEGEEFPVGVPIYECNGAFDTPNNSKGYPYLYLGIYVGTQEPLTVRTYEWCIRSLRSISEVLENLQNQITGLSNNLNTEINTRQQEDIRIEGKIDTTKTYLEGEISSLDTKLSNSIQQEENARIQGDINLQNTKQDTLVSGETIKTINGQNVLGSGDLKVSFDPESLTELNMLCYEEVEDNGE